MASKDEENRLETGTTSALDRMALTGRLTERIIPILERQDFYVHEFGQHVILQQNSGILARFKRLESKKSREVLMLKFAPDYLCSYKKRPDGLFLLEAKASITPVFFNSQIDKIRAASNLASLQREDIGEVEREAWDVYNRFYPKERVAICFATPYHPRLLLTEWVSKIKPLFRFDEDKNELAGGSGTPHVNIHLGRMRTLPEFLASEFGVELAAEAHGDLLTFIKSWPLNKPRGRVNWVQFNNVVNALQRTCPWLQERWLDGDPRANLRKARLPGL